jgi:hypothetical protein
MWAGLDSHPIPTDGNRQYCHGYAAGRAVLAEMQRRREYVIDPEAKSAELKRKIVELRSKLANQARRTHRAVRAYQSAIGHIQSAGSRSGHHLDVDTDRGEVRP